MSTSPVVARVASTWSVRAPRYNTHYRNYPVRDREEWRSAVGQAVAALRPGRPLSVLDVGTGTGFLSTLLAELGHRVTGIDVSPRMLDYARQEARRRDVDVRLLLHGADDVPALGERFDLVTARYVLWTLPDPAAALAGWRTVLRPGGALLVCDGLWRTWRRGWHQVRDSLRPGADHTAGWRLLREYLTVGRVLPYWRGLTTAETRALLRSAGFGAPRRFDHLLAPAAHPDAAEFVMLGAHPDLPVRQDGHAASSSR